MSRNWRGRKYFKRKQMLKCISENPSLSEAVKTMSLSRPLFPSDLPNWSEVKALINELKENCQTEAFDDEDIARHIQLIYETNHASSSEDAGQRIGALPDSKERTTSGKRRKLDQTYLWYGVLKFLKKSTEEETDRFLFTVLPGICDLVLSSEKLIPSDLVFSEQQACSTSVLSKRFVASILACSFFCLFPERERSRRAKLNVINFTNFFKHLPIPSQIAKMRCMINYFDRVTEANVEMSGNITYSRQVIERNLLPHMDDVLASEAELCSMHIHTVGVVEDIGSDGIEVDFANRCIGGGALGRGRVQEEIRFMTCPELVASMLFMETMEDNEAITISGYEQFSEHSGYASGLEYVGNYRDFTEVDESGNLKRMLCAIDAVPFKSNKFKQYTHECIMRELNKALVGFCDMWQSEGDSSSHSVVSSQCTLNTSTEEEYHTAVSSPGEEGTQRRLSGFVVTLLSEAMHQAVKDSVDKHKEEHNLSNEETKDIDQSKTSCDSLSQSELNIPEVSQSGGDSDNSCDRNHNQVPRTIPTHPQNGSSDLLEVGYGDWLTNFRRRSSNLSDVSRRSSSSTKHSSDLSSDLEEIYETYMKNEKKKHGTIKEETCQPGIADFATKLIACLMQEGTTTAAQMMPGMQTFHNTCPQEDVVKPCAVRPAASIDSEEPSGESLHENSEEQNNQELQAALQNYAQSLMDATLPSAFQEVANLALTPPPPDPTNQVLPTDRMYEWYADQIVQQVFLHVSQELTCEEPCDSNVNSSCNSDQPAQGFSSSSAVLDLPPSTAASNSSPSADTSQSAASAHNISSSSSASMPLMERRVSLEGCAPDQQLTDGCISESVIEQANIQSLTCDTRTSTPKPDQREDTSSNIPPNTEKIIPTDFEIRLDYHEAAAIIVDHVFQSLPTHLGSLVSAGVGNHSLNGKSGSIRSVSSPRGSFKGVSDTVSSVSDGKESVHGAKAEEPEKTSRAGLPNVGVLTKKLSREMLTNAFLNVEDRRHIKSYERRSSEPCHVSVELSLQVYNTSKLSRDEEKRRKISRTDDDLEKVRGEVSRRGSWSSFPTARRRSSCGFKDPILSKFAEELMKTDTTVPPLFFMGANTNTSTTGSRRSSLSGFKDATLANLENELLNSSFNQPSSPRHSIRSRGSRRSKMARSESSETEYWFPLPKKVGTECQEELFRTGYYHSVDEIEDFADMFANDILNQAVNIIHRDAYLELEREELANSEGVHSYADELATSVIRLALENLQSMSVDEAETVICNSPRPKSNDTSGESAEFADALDVPFTRLEGFANTLSGQLMKEAMSMLKKHAKSKNRFQSRGLPIATGNWGCGAFGGDPQLKSMLQWMAASLVRAPELHYYTFNDGRLIQFDEIVAVIQSLGWTVGRLMREVKAYCDMVTAEKRDLDSYPSITLFEYIVSNIYM